MNPAAVVRRARRSLRLYGVRGTAERAVGALRAAGQPEAPDAFDERYGTDTARPMRLEGLRVRGQHRDLGVRYQPSEPEAVLRKLTATPVDVAAATCIDLGSGKGRVVLLAATLPFRRVVGVEFGEELDAIARANLERFPDDEIRAGEVELVCADATEYVFPSTPLVIYAYNPFLEPVMRRVLANLRASLDEAPRPCAIVLEGDQALAPLIRSAGFRETAPGLFVDGAPVDNPGDNAETAPAHQER